LNIELNSRIYNDDHFNQKLKDWFGGVAEIFRNIYHPNGKEDEKVIWIKFILDPDIVTLQGLQETINDFFQAANERFKAVERSES